MKFIEPKWFKKEGKEIVLLSSYCMACNLFFFPAKPICLNCFTDILLEKPLSRTGKLHTFTLSNMGPDGIEKPYIMGFIDLPENIKLFSLIRVKNSSLSELKIGMDMEMDVAPIKVDQNGEEIWSYVFRPQDPKCFNSRI